MTAAVERSGSQDRTPTRRSRGWPGLLTDPARCFLAIGAIGGLVLVFLVPPLEGIDEAAHYTRAYQVSTGRLVPLTPYKADEGAGACIPNDVSEDLAGLIYDNILRRGGSGPATPPGGARRIGIHAPPCSDQERFVDFSAFGWYSPLPYLPQAVVIAPARWLGVGTETQLILARLATLAVYLALVFVAIRRSPFARWGLCAVALLPVSLFQAATSRSPDAMTIGIAMLVLVSALRAVKGGLDRETGSPMAERIVLVILLGLLKPTYALIGLCFLLPLLARGRRSAPAPESWPTLVVPALVAIGTSVIWQSYAGHYFVCDTVFFGMEPDVDAQIEHILSVPFDYAWAVIRSFWDFTDNYLDEAATLGTTVANWAWWGIGAVLIAVGVAAARRDRSERFTLGGWQRALLLAIVVAGAVGVITGEHVYCASAGETDIVYPPHARHFLPLLPLLVVMLTPSRRDHAAPSWTSRIPSAALLAGVTTAFIVGAGLEMR